MGNGTITIPAVVRKMVGKEIGEYIDVIVVDGACPQN